MRSQRISKEDFFGIFFTRKPDRTRWDSYYNTIEALRPLLGDNEFNNVVNGFYLNHIKESVRISYFVDKTHSEKATSTFRNFFRDNQIQEIGSEPPREAVVAENYGGEELEERFRNFLSLQTQIGLDLIEADLLQARILFATYSLQVRKASSSVRKHFQPIFMKHSSTYASLSKEAKEQFLSDLETLPNWTHMMVNFVLGSDWQVFLDGIPLSIPKINEILRRDNLGFQIPLDWKTWTTRAKLCG